MIDAHTPTITEADILAEVIVPECGDLLPEVARSVLDWKFTDRSISRMTELADRNNKGTVSAAELEELHRYLRVGSLVNLMQAKARLSLKHSQTGERPMPKVDRQQVWGRAGGCCEYCRMPQEYDVQPHQLDHIRAQKHGGPTIAGNLALCVPPCNSYKGPSVAGYDPDTNTLAPLYNPRGDDWEEHFVWDGPVLMGKTAVGGATVVVLRINAVDRVEHRRLLIQAGLFPPKRS